MTPLMSAGGAFALAWLLTVCIEGLVLHVALSASITSRTRRFAALWLSSCTLPVVHFVFPAWRAAGASDVVWIVAAELFAPIAECLLFECALAPTSDRWTRWRNRIAIVTANGLSFAIGVLVLG